MFKRSYISGHTTHPHYIDEQTLENLKNTLMDSKKQLEISIVFKALSDPTKLSIYTLLHRVQELPVTDIVYILSSSPSTISHALSDLKKLDLIECSRCGQLMCYSINKKSKNSNAILLLEKMFIQL